MATIQATIEQELLTWPGVTSAPHRFGGIEFHAANHEIGHIHGDRLADLPFPRRVRDELVAAGRANPHHVLPDTGWVSYHLHGSNDVPAVLELFRLNYDRIMKTSTSTLVVIPTS